MPSESWSDLRAFDGTATIQQPLIAPLYNGKTAHELLAILLGDPDRSGLEIGPRLLASSESCRVISSRLANGPAVTG